MIDQISIRYVANQSGTGYGRRKIIIIIIKIIRRKTIRTFPLKGKALNNNKNNQKKNNKDFPSERERP